jgi:signal transduction protein with GAF and PtsI domain
VLAQLERVLEVGKASGRPVSLCGEMASEPLWAVVLVGMGYETLSVAPPSVPLVKWVLRSVPFEAATRAARGALSAATATAAEDAAVEAVRPHVDLNLLGIEPRVAGAEGGG